MDNVIKLLAGGAAAVLLLGSLSKNRGGVSGVGAAYNGSYADRVHVLLLDNGQTIKIELYHAAIEAKARIEELDRKAGSVGFKVEEKNNTFGEWKRVYTRGETVCVVEVYYTALN